AKRAVYRNGMGRTSPPRSRAVQCLVFDFYEKEKYPRGPIGGGEGPAMTLAEITAKMKEGASKKSSFGNTVKFSTDQGVVYIDGNATPPAVSNDDKAA